MQLRQSDTPRSMHDMKVKGRSMDSDHLHSVYTTLDTHVSEFSHALPVRNSYVQESELPHVLSANLLRETGENQAEFVANQRAEFEKIKKMDIPISLKIQLLTGSVDGLLGHLNLLKLSNQAIKDRIIAHEKMSQYAHFLSTNGSNSASQNSDSKIGVENHVMELLLTHQNPGSPTESNAINKFIAAQHKTKRESAVPGMDINVDDKNYMQFLLNEIKKLEDTIVDFKSTRNRVAEKLDDTRDMIIQQTNYIGEQSISLEHKMAQIEQMKEFYAKSSADRTFVKTQRKIVPNAMMASSINITANKQPKTLTMTQSVANFNRHPIDPNESFCERHDLEVEPQAPGSAHRKQPSGFFGNLTDRFKNLVG